MAATKNDGVSRVERAALVKELKEKGLTHRQIQALLKISTTYYYELLNDPDGTRARRRKEKYSGTCVDCGGITSYSTKPIQRCLRCSRKRIHDKRKWTRERILTDIQRWNDLYGEPPKAMEWLTTGAPRGTRDREWPHVGIIQREFGSWSNALEAAGFERRVNYLRTDEWKDKVTKWPRQKIIEAMRSWVAEYGVVPMASDWKEHSGYPSPTTVLKKFGSWNAGIRAAGLEPRRHYRKGPDREPLIEIPSFEERGEGRSLLEIVRDLDSERSSNGRG